MTAAPVQECDRANDLYQAAGAAAEWLNRHNGTSDAELSLRILKLSEEAGEVGAAWIGVCGQNPRKGVTHTCDQVVGELADVVLTALTAIASLGYDPQSVMAACVAKVTARFVSTQEVAR